MKRDPALVQLSRDHHHALVFAKSLRADAPLRLTARLPTAAEALCQHVRERFARELTPHFELEENVLLPLCEAHGEPLDALAKQVQHEHAALRTQITSLDPAAPHLRQLLDDFGRGLELHVRFEERTWFPALERVLTPDTLARVAASLR